MARGLPDHVIGIYLLDCFGYKAKLPVYEVAPCTGLYDPDETPLTSKIWTAIRVDSIRRARVVVDSLPSGWDPTGTFKVDLQKVLGSPLSKTNPVNVRLSDGTVDIPFPVALDGGALKIKEQNPLSSINVGNWPSDFPDSAVATLLGGGLPLTLVSDKLKVRASEIETLLAAGLPAALDTGALKIREQNPLTSIDVGNFPTNYPDSSVLAEVTQPTTAAPYNITMTSANTEYSQAITGTVRAFDIYTSDLTAMRFAFVTGKVAGPTAPVFYVPANSVYYATGVKLSNPTFYFASSTAGKICNLNIYT